MPQAAYLKKQGGTVSSVICSWVQGIVAWSELHWVTLSGRYITGRNTLANQWSCPDPVLPTKWSPLPECLMHV